MRDRPYLSAGESPRPYSEILAERRRDDPASRALADVAAMEAEALAAPTEDERRRLQCQAEALRCDLYHRPRETR